MAADAAHHPASNRRLRHLWPVAAAALVGGGLIAALAAGWDGGRWFHEVWKSFRAVSFVYVVPALALQTLQMLFSAYACFRILQHAYPGAQIRRLPVFACYATGVALNCFLPANGGMLVTILMLVAVVEPATFAGVVGAAAVEKLFFAVAGMLVYLYLFLGVGGSFALKFGAESRHPWVTTLAVLAVVAVVAVAMRLGWRWLRGVWAQAKQGGRILADRRAYVRHVLVPQLLSWCCRAGVIAVLLVAYGIPVGFQRTMLLIGGNSLANVASVTPGGIGVSQALNVASLHDATSSATASAYSVGQQLLATAWNVVLALVFLGAAFGWAGARRLVKQSLGGARERSAERLS
ncbi:MAG TPA: lysylphosphatidylglycerol synthase transmembrane domain-containing protein [Gaiellaceae bacterium]|jgi:uncharacterized membrane protein YbhN (UPF0104 family)|nr:lysylphosphatidylglycerol synthase transmembrane domain-containing protein [Gaiellaceae bacterium]